MCGSPPRRRRPPRDGRDRRAHGAAYFRRPGRGRQGRQHQPALPGPTPRSSRSSTATTSRPGVPRDVPAGVRLPRSPSSRPRSTTPTGPGGVAEASWAQQSLFFGPSRGARRARCHVLLGTNVVFRRTASTRWVASRRTRSPRTSSCPIRLHEQGWTTRYLPRRAGVRTRSRGHGFVRVPAAALGPGVPRRAARGCSRPACRPASACSTSCRRPTWLTGWTLLIYMLFPVVRILTGAQPIAVRPPRSSSSWGPVLPGQHADRRGGRRGPLHVRGVLRDVGQLLDPRRSPACSPLCAARAASR